MPNEVKEHLDKLNSYLKCRDLSIQARVWLLNAVVSIKLDMEKTALADGQ